MKLNHLAACACNGPEKGEPLCPCALRRLPTVMDAIAAARLEAFEEAAKIADEWAENCGVNYDIPRDIAAEIRTKT